MSHGRVFADTSYWGTLILPSDPLHSLALATARQVAERGIVTTDEVLTELLNFFSSFGPSLRDTTARTVDDLYTDEQVLIIPQTRDTLRAGLNLYRARRDKAYSLTDCISMTAMRERSIVDILTHDRHFTQEGFTTLL
jgi:uncharacterized protein